MRISTKLTKIYFNAVYNRVYDFIVGQYASYHRLQNICVNKLKLNDGNRILCVGVGTGNEVLQILTDNSEVSIVGIDYSETALEKACKKARARGHEIELLAMNAQNLEFASGSFDKVICVHVMDWVEEDEEIASEIIRVLRVGGQFVITYPSEKENAKLGVKVLGDTIRYNIKAGKPLKLVTVFLSTLLGTIIYLPLLLRPRKRLYSRQELDAAFSGVVDGDFQIEEYPVYHDYIVYGTKFSEGELLNAA